MDSGLLGCSALRLGE